MLYALSGSDDTSSYSNSPTSPNNNGAVLMSPTSSGGGVMSSHQSGHNYSGHNPHSTSSIANCSAVPSSQSVQQLSHVGNGSGAVPMNPNPMLCVAHSQSAHQLGLHQQLQQRFAAAAAANSSSHNNYGTFALQVAKYRRGNCGWPLLFGLFLRL